MFEAVFMNVHGAIYKFCSYSYKWVYHSALSFSKDLVRNGADCVSFYIDAWDDVTVVVTRTDIEINRIYWEKDYIYRRESMLNVLPDQD